MAWSNDPDLRALWLEPPPTTIRWEKVMAALARGGATVKDMPDLHLLVFCRGRVAWFHHGCAGRMWRYQVRALRDFLDGNRGEDGRGKDGTRGGADGLRHRGWLAAVGFDAADELLVGRLVGTDDVVCFHGTDVRMLVGGFHQAVADHEAACGALRRPAKPASGSLRLRMRPRTHARAQQAAAIRGISLNSWIELAILRTANVELRDV